MAGISPRLILGGRWELLGTDHHVIPQSANGVFSQGVNQSPKGQGGVGISRIQSIEGRHRSTASLGQPRLSKVGWPSHI